ncbi:hypothetical protein THMIRHAS_04180 [Thiosulfatimonas sediminis]|uniref:Uncharacterized protein n=1 Tax=Thiosulfatimonas sediminis TaxID=2675054 RepID=A0A6F8PSF1_9GAMM|nr:hypothetical protein [Thiosulfatimonas sediminis]BBP45045.1 hypothetical protein THMIRHAS_04180 [Thiosulfatimonas sediminis]
MPLACQYYSELEVAAMRNTSVTLIENGKILYQGKVKTLSTQAGKEFLVTPEDERIPLDNVERVEKY